MRISDSMRYTALSLDNERNSQALMVAAQKSSSGVAVSQPSTDPVAYSSMVSQDGNIARVTSRKNGIDRATDDLNLADGALGSATDLLVEAKSVALQMANGTQNAQDRASAASIVDSLKTTLLGIANTKGAKGYVFAGTNTGTAPFTAAAAFTGNNGVVGVEIADNTVVSANASGAKAFTAAGGQDAFQALSTLSTALSNNDVAGIEGSLDALDKAHDQIVGARTDVGNTLSRLTSASQVTTNAITTLQTARASTVDADAIQAFSDLSRTQTAYQASIQVTAQILSLPLFNPGG